MQQRSLGNTGLKVTDLGLGTWTWARETDEHEARDQLRSYLDAGGNLIDTAAVYGNGASEELLGHLLREVGRREDLVIATKAGVTFRDGDRSKRELDTSRKAILETLDASLKRLQLDHVDLWQMHVWSDNAPIEETLAAMDDAVRSGRVMYAGISNYNAWQTAQAATLQSVLGRTPLASTQVQYSLLDRRVEESILPAAAATGLGVLAWSPLASGALTGKYRSGTPSDSRGATDEYGPRIEAYLDDHGRGVVEAVCRAADGLGWTPTEVALAWVRDRPGMTAPLLGARTAAQLKAALSVADKALPPELVAALDDVSAE
ncbi:oxidoreductase [Nocardioides baekrokdamisoli]|uniref:Oxidoreductase n=1 Tax=Nocardioides baekrokdamisoli TaxID=1804624 RepID=A0A3G9IXC5_9ACTN|nr:aldo/keto reductase [Nocardioides baekrokdamisoli]BBH15928.1 oxidoreductase [Nocardioides baekrokdamisoli]